MLVGGAQVVVVVDGPAGEALGGFVSVIVVIVVMIMIVVVRMTVTVAMAVAVVRVEVALVQQPGADPGSPQGQGPRCPWPREKWMEVGLNSRTTLSPPDQERDHAQHHRAGEGRPVAHLAGAEGEAGIGGVDLA